ncbi:MAG: hypothetical protein KTR26_20205 [Flammeovirgaceae bacterium]|nr:hypothetical protein [Flammeovirgaceae bacterium]
MSSIVFISILSVNEFAFGNSLLKSIREEFPKISLFDFDNHSESMVVNYAIEFLQETTNPIVIIDCKSEGQVNFRPFFNQLIKKKKEVNILVKEENESLSRFIKPFPNKILDLKNDKEVLETLTKILADQKI